MKHFLRGPSVQPPRSFRGKPRLRRHAGLQSSEPRAAPRGQKQMRNSTCNSACSSFQQLSAAVCSFQQLSA
eukprot:15479380-Alexandrium_andersonii.AAC.1